MFLSGMNKRTDILWETGAAVATAGVKEFAADTDVGSDGSTHAVDIEI